MVGQNVTKIVELEKIEPYVVDIVFRLLPEIGYYRCVVGFYRFRTVLAFWNLRIS